MIVVVGRLKNWNVVISGGATGAGGASSELFAKEGAQIAIVDINDDAAQRTAERIRQQGGRAFVTVADVSRASDVEKAASQILDTFNGRVDCLFNHAGTVIVKDFLDTDEADWDFMMNVNVKSMFLMTRAFLPVMLRAGKKSIVNTSSISAVAGTEKEVLYCTSKGACHMFTRAIAIEYRAAGIRCNAVCPGFIRTPHGLRELDELRAQGVDVSEDDIVRLQGRICEPHEVAAAALFLASDEASFVNGETLFVDNAMLVGT
jgi:NAD(P)-dependent dehydrogenase (short-subunit alcohol dehydrogenase family)